LLEEYGRGIYDTLSKKYKKDKDSFDDALKRVKNDLDYESKFTNIKEIYIDVKDKK